MEDKTIQTTVQQQYYISFMQFNIRLWKKIKKTAVSVYEGIQTSEIFICYKNVPHESHLSLMLYFLHWNA